MTKQLPIWVWVFTLLAAVGSLVSIAQRHRVEAGNRAVALALEWPVIAEAAATSGLPVDQAIIELQQAGMRAVVLPEDTIGDALDRGDLRLVVDSVGEAKWLVGRLSQDDVQKALRRRSILTPSSDGRGIQLGADLPYQVLRSVSLGLDPVVARQVKGAGLFLVARSSNVPSPSLEYVKAIVSDAGEKGADGFLPQGDSVLGSRAHLKEMAETLKLQGMVYCSPEFAKMVGETTMLTSNPENVVRLHAIQAAEIERMTPQEVIERYARAAGERNQRILLVRPFDSSQDTPLRSLAASLDLVAKGVVKEKLAVSQPRPWANPSVPAYAPILIACGVFGACCGLATTVLSSRWSQGVVILLGFLSCGLALKGNPQYLATFAAMIFPVLAYEGLKSWRKCHPVIQFGLISLVSIVGGLCVAGLLNGPAYFVRAESFWAVKMAHFLPIIAVTAMVVRDQFELPKVAMTPVTWGALFVGGVALIGLGFMLARTGNDNPAAVSGVELKLRSVLERYFSVRPRTKEFAIGHPAMFIGLAALARPNRKAQVTGGFLTALGMIGQTSMVNTMCHLHTPVFVGLVRIAIGLVAGLAVGLALWPLVRRWLPA